MGADLVVETLQRLQAGTITPRPQNNSLSSLAPILKKEDGVVDFNRSATEIVNRIRGFKPWPGVRTKFRGKALQIAKARAVSTDAAVAIAELKVSADRLFVGCSQQTVLELIEVQLEGKNRTAARDFIQGYRPVPGEKLG